MFVPVGDIITENTTREEIEQHFQEKVEIYKNNGMEPYSYLWASIKNRKDGDIVVRVTICCNEYIVGIVLYDVATNDIKIWDLNTQIEKRDILSFPTRGKYYWYGRYSLLFENGYVIIKHDRSTIALITTEQFIDFLDNSKENKLGIDKVVFLDYDIIETLTDDRNKYYGVLDIFKNLYNDGYWTYGGFKNYVKSEDKIQDTVKVTYLNKSFTLTKDGNVSGTNIATEVSDTLKWLGATIL
jgi:hypothetical protein